MQWCGVADTLDKATPVSRRKAAHFLILKEHNQRSVLQRIAGIECVRVGKSEGLNLHQERGRHGDPNSTDLRGSPKCSQSGSGACSGKDCIGLLSGAAASTIVVLLQVVGRRWWVWVQGGVQAAVLTPPSPTTS